MKMLPWIALLSSMSAHADVVGISPPWEPKGVYYVFDDCTIQYAGAYNVTCQPGFSKIQDPAIAAVKGLRVSASINGSAVHQVTINHAGILGNGERYYALTID